MPIKNPKKLLLNISLYFSLLVAGFVLAKFISFPEFTISKDIDLLNIGSILVTIWLAIFVSVVFEQYKSNNRVEKDLLIARIGEVHDITNQLQIECSTGKIGYSDAAATIKRIRSALNSNFRLIGKTKINLDGAQKKKLNKQLKDLRDTLTATPTLAEKTIDAVDLPINVKDGIAYYSQLRISEIEVLFDKFKDKLLELQIEINGK